MPTGLGLDCDGTTAGAQTVSGSTGATAEATAEFELQTTPVSGGITPQATARATTGELVVLICTCADVPEDTAGFDWFGLCDSEGGVYGLSLAPVIETSVEPMTMTTVASGDATFPDLEPGLYSLEMAEGTWCKAVSDNVDAKGSVTIEAGARTTVYGFVCEGKPAT